MWQLEHSSTHNLKKKIENPNKLFDFLVYTVYGIKQEVVVMTPSVHSILVEKNYVFLGKNIVPSSSNPF